MLKVVYWKGDIQEISGCIDRIANSNEGSKIFPKIKRKMKQMETLAEYYAAASSKPTSKTEKSVDNSDDSDSDTSEGI
jgi:hypothetical protein